MKHNLTFLSTLLATTFLAGNALAESCGEGCTYTLTTNEYGARIAKIDDGVTSIPAGGFSFNSDIEEVIIPDSVTSIEDYAFYSASRLTSITIPDSVTSIGNNAFEDSDLTSIVISPFTEIGREIFDRTANNINIVFEDDGDSSLMRYARNTTLILAHFPTNANLYCRGELCQFLAMAMKDHSIPYDKDENGVYDVGGTLYSSAADMGLSASCGDMANCLASIGTHCSTAEECQTLLDMSSEGTNCNSLSSCKTYLAEHPSAGNKTDSALIEKYNGTPLLYGKKIYTIQEAEDALSDGTKFHVGLTYK